MEADVASTLAQSPSKTDETTLLVTAFPKVAFGRIVEAMYPKAILGWSSTDFVQSDVADTATVFPGACIAEAVEIGAGTQIAVGAVIGRGAKIGNDCIVGPNATIGAGVVLGIAVPSVLVRAFLLLGQAMTVIFEQTLWWASGGMVSL